MERTEELSNSGGAGGMDRASEAEKGVKVESDDSDALSKQDIDNPRRSTRVRNRPKHLEDYTVLALCAESFVEDVPEHFDDIQGREDEEQWLRAVNEEITSLIENKT